jgi:hypothetical protein
VLPRKIRDLKADLRRAGFTEVKGGGKGNVIISGHDGNDADRYQEQDVRLAIASVKGAP